MLRGWKPWHQLLPKFKWNGLSKRNLSKIWRLMMLRSLRHILPKIFKSLLRWSMTILHSFESLQPSNLIHPLTNQLLKFHFSILIKFKEFNNQLQSNQYKCRSQYLSLKLIHLCKSRINLNNPPHKKRSQRCFSMKFNKHLRNWKSKPNIEQI